MGTALGLGAGGEGRGAEVWPSHCGAAPACLAVWVSGDHPGGHVPLPSPQSAMQSGTRDGGGEVPGLGYLALLLPARPQAASPAAGQRPPQSLHLLLKRSHRVVRPSQRAPSRGCHTAGSFNAQCNAFSGKLDWKASRVGREGLGGRGRDSCRHPAVQRGPPFSWVFFHSFKAG